MTGQQAYIVYEDTSISAFTGALQFEIDPDDFNGGSHTLTITATSQTGEIEQYIFSYGKN